MADCGQLRMPGANCGRLWPTLCSSCFATVCDELTVQVTMADCGRVWLTLADCGRLRLTGADCGRQWPTLCSFCFATVFDYVTVQVTDTFWPTVGGRGRLWVTVADCGPTSPRPAHPNRGAWSLMPRPVREGCCPEERHEAPARQHRSDTNIVTTPPPLSPVVLAATRGMLSLPSTHYLPSVPPTPARCYKSDGARRGATRPPARHCDCDCGRLWPTEADSVFPFVLLLFASVPD